MKSISRLILLSTAIFIGTGARAAEVSPVIGHWEGVQRKDGQEMPIAFDFKSTGSELAATISLPASGVLDAPLFDLNVSANKFAAKYGNPEHPVEFSGEVEGDKMTGTLTAGKRKVEFGLSRVTPNLPYKIEPATFQNGDVKLVGELFMPSSPGTHPAIVHLHGSGDYPRQWHYFFADFFARRGIACLVYDKRGVGDSTGKWKEVGFWELAEDGVEGAHFLQKRADVDPKRVGMFGISQAGWLIPMAASRSKDIAFIVVISGGAVKVEREGYWDYEYAMRKKGFSEADIKEAIDFMRLENAVTRTGEGYDELRARWKEVKTKPWYPNLGYVIPTPPKNKSRDWYRRVMDIDHVPIVKSLDIPALWLQGADDETFPAEEAVKILEDIKREGNKDFVIKVFPKAMHGIHLPPAPDSPFPFRTYAAGYFDTISDWLKQKVTHEP